MHQSAAGAAGKQAAHEHWPCPACSTVHPTPPQPTPTHPTPLDSTPPHLTAPRLRTGTLPTSSRSCAAPRRCTTAGSRAWCSRSACSGRRTRRCPSRSSSTSATSRRARLGEGGCGHALDPANGAAVAVSARPLLARPWLALCCDREPATARMPPSPAARPQAQHDYLAGNYPVVRDDAAQMAALQMQVRGGNQMEAWVTRREPRTGGHSTLGPLCADGCASLCAASCWLVSAGTPPCLAAHTPAGRVRRCARRRPRRAGGGVRARHHAPGVQHAAARRVARRRRIAVSAPGAQAHVRRGRRTHPLAAARGSREQALPLQPPVAPSHHPRQLPPAAALPPPALPPPLRPPATRPCRSSARRTRAPSSCASCARCPTARPPSSP